MADTRAIPEPLARSIGSHLRGVERYFVPWDAPTARIRPGIEWCDHGLDLDFDGTVVGILWMIRDGDLSLEATATPVAGSFLGDPPLDYQRHPVDHRSMWSTLIGRRLTAARWSPRLGCAIELSFDRAVVTIAAADWKDDPPPIRQCSDSMLMLFGDAWHDDVDR